MAWRTVHIANCKTASIRKTPWIPLYDKVITGIRDGPTNKDNTIKMGESIEIDINNTCYDWTGRKFYATKRPKGWIHEGVIDLGDTNNG